MHALDVVDNPLHWETERQNRIHQEAVEQRKKLAGTGAGTAPRSLSRNDGMSNNTEAALAADSGQRSFLGDAERLRYYWIDKVLRIPRIRSALIPLDETSEADSWSKPLSLKKADIEPFASFFRGYCRSRLFLEPVSLRAGQIDSSEALQLDFPVRALFELRGFDAKFIFDPPVQIDAQIEFHDLEEDLRECRDHARMRLLIEMAESMHDKQLEQAVARGREMGDALHDALMGEGHVNLIRAWERVHQRKPTIQELHLMLTTGRISVEQRQDAASTSTRHRPAPAPVAEERRAEAMPRRAVPITPRAAAPQPQAAAIPVEQHVPEEEAGTNVSASEAKAASSSSRVRQVFLYLLHAAVGGAALVAYTWYF
ncbi:hypothetical protein RY831_10800 [Noviherbaspirillum sp. CPCC 100848]|uniref:Uncharacterized protein n=1 Tax=Noviherbaspirillum album TaxID=3080276 RepID=A0ABU6J7Z8_9BURK|nr:hypothetical protein [Noviherbaspirillum sp. CPCC 100848]MEC4719638.1 hypothetical protein [Noviherbaspirillum sp. CPCC 100848]